MTPIREEIETLREGVDALRDEIAEMRGQLTEVAIALAGTYPMIMRGSRSSQAGGNTPSIGIYSWGEPRS